VRRFPDQVPAQQTQNCGAQFPIHITQPEGCPNNVFAFIKGFALWDKTYQKLKRVYSGLDYSFSVSELVWRHEDGLYIPDNIITRKPERFVFDLNWKLYLNEFGARKPLDQPYKWLEYHHDTDDENPYGTSVLRCVYWSYMFKKRVMNSGCRRLRNFR
jgi:hypothetical protein